MISANWVDEKPDAFGMEGQERRVSALWKLCGPPTSVVAWVGNRLWIWVLIHRPCQARWWMGEIRYFIGTTVWK